jgi:cytochrome oxidase Cu insertion factor (SCO1/SenC/PrrC family)
MFALLFILASAAGAKADAQEPSSGPVQSTPDFTLPDQDGKMWKLSDTLKDYHAVVLAFYPKDDTGV